MREVQATGVACVVSMRASAFLLLAALALPAVVTFAPAASAHHYGTVGCDIDDDLYNHCGAGNVHWVTGPGCFGVRVDGQLAQCRPVVDPTLLA